MQKDAFVAMLQADNFSTFVTVEREAHGSLDLHTHPFEARALILEGSLDLVIDGIQTHYGVGDVFSLNADQPHSETYGEHGVKYLVGRK